ncbi:hypothetical protein [Glutamicibacter sp. JC586]|uniref:hypothetical protein n=1 Tax=Glutamicibacter sp. JC586 TaxID=2590552 RepID=UPI001359E914|nr:hypothetical protein [Glutamicibacter sp. JC586]
MASTARIFGMTITSLGKKNRPTVGGAVLESPQRLLFEHQNVVMGWNIAFTIHLWSLATYRVPKSRAPEVIGGLCQVLKSWRRPRHSP